MDTKIEQSWEIALKNYFNTPEFEKLSAFVKERYRTTSVYPTHENLFNAFNQTPFDKVKVVILGQDPYHNPEQAHGLCFSVPSGVTLPPSLRNIYKEIYSDVRIQKDPSDGNLESWAQQGVLLLNSVLSVEKNNPASHANKGWELFTDKVIKSISDQKEHCVFLLWGKYAQKKGQIIDRKKHLVLESAHPSPFSAYRGFLGNKHFSQTNDYLKRYDKKTINW